MQSCYLLICEVHMPRALRTDGLSLTLTDANATAIHTRDGTMSRMKSEAAYGSKSP